MFFSSRHVTQTGSQLLKEHSKTFQIKQKTAIINHRQPGGAAAWPQRDILVVGGIRRLYNFLGGRTGIAFVP